MRIERGVGMGRNVWIDEVGEISRVVEESGLFLITCVEDRSGSATSSHRRLRRSAETN